MAEAAAAGVAIESLTKQLRALKQELATLDPNTAKFQELAIQAGQVKDQINDASEAMNANAGSAFEVLGNNAGQLTQRLGNLDFEGVSQSAKAMAGSLGRISFKDITNGVKSMGSAFSALGKALMTNPIFLIAGVLALIAMNLDTVAKIIPGVGAAMDSLSEAITGVSAEMNKALADSKKLTEEAQKQLDTTSASENILKLQGKSEKEILQLKIAQTKSVIDGLKAQITSQQAINTAQFETAKRNKEIIKGILQYLTAPLQVLLATVDQVGKALGQDFGLRDTFNNNVANLFFDPEQTKAEGEAALEEQKKQLLALENNVAGYQLSIQGIDKTAADKRKAEAQKAADELAKINEKAAEDEKKRLEKAAADSLAAREAYAQANMDAQENETHALLQEQMKQLADFTGTEEERLLLVESFALREQQIMEKYDQLAADADAKAKDDEEARAKDARDKKEAEDELAAEKEKARLEKIAAFKEKSIADSFALITDLTNLFNNGSEKSAKRAFQINKATSLAQAIVSTYQNATKAYGSQLIVGDPTSIPRAQIAGGLALAAGLANVAKIAKTQYQSSASSGGGGGSTGGGGGGSLGSGGGGAAMTSVTPSFNPLNTSFLNNRPAQTGAVQAYVLSSNVSSAMEANQKVKDQTVL
jgi:uncharacterized membrane protein YgcG